MGCMQENKHSNELFCDSNELNFGGDSQKPKGRLTNQSI